MHSRRSDDAPPSFSPHPVCLTLLPEATAAISESAARNAACSAGPKDAVEMCDGSLHDLERRRMNKA